MLPVTLLSLIVFLPAIMALVIALLLPAAWHNAIRYTTLATTGAVLLLCIVGFFFVGETQFDTAAASMQNVFSIPWIPSFDIDYFMGLDGISFPLVMLTALVSLLAMGASWSITRYVKAYCILFLLLVTGMLGVFLALDFFLFYVFWEVMLLPMYFLIGVWGGPRREYAAIKFFLYTLLGSVLMLIAILLLYFHSDVRQIVPVSDLNRDLPDARVTWESLHLGPRVDARVGRMFIGEYDGKIELIRTGAEAARPLTIQILPPFDKKPLEHTKALYVADANVVQVQLAQHERRAMDVAQAMEANPRVKEVVRAFVAQGIGQGTIDPLRDSRVGLAAVPAIDQPVHTFNLLALSAIGQFTPCFSSPLLGGWSLQVWCFVLLFVGFIIKVPSVPLHTWLPDAHVEAPTPISMILAGVLLKMGGYGIIRICYPICPEGGYELAYLVCLIGVISMVYGAFAALAQKDFKRLVAYSSVSHMGYVVLGLGVWSARDYALFSTDYWNMGVQGAMFQMIAHGISSSGMFFLVGVIYDRVHHRNLDQFGGLYDRMPVYTALSIGIFFAALGLPGLCGFIGEVFVVLAVFKYDVTLAIISASVVILTAGYILWAVQRVYLGPDYRGPHGEALTPSTPRENTIAAVLLVFAIVLGVFPYQSLLRYMDRTIEQQVNALADWTARVKEPSAPPDTQSQPAKPPAAARLQLDGDDLTLNQGLTWTAIENLTSSEDRERESARTR